MKTHHEGKAQGLAHQRGERSEGSQLEARARRASIARTRGTGVPLRRGLVLMAAFAALLLIPSFASAAGSRQLGQFCEPSGVGAAPCEPEFTEPAGMTVYQSGPEAGDVLVIDLSSHSLRRFHADGTPAPFSALSGSNEIDGKTGADKVTSGAEEILSYEEPAVASRETEVAVAPPGSPNSTEGDIYVTDSQHGRIVVFGPGGEYLSQHAIPSIPCGVAVDPSGKVFVGSYEGANAGVTKLTPAGSGALTEDSHFGTATTCQVAASEGFVYAAEFGGQIHKIDSATGTTKYALGSGQNITVSIDPASGHLFTTDHSIGQVEEYDVSGTTEAKLLAITPTTSGPFGVAVEGESGRLYVSRIGHANVEVFGLRRQLGQFCEPSGVGAAPCEPEFTEPAGMTVYQSGPEAGDVLVIDLSSHSLRRFHADGTPAPFSALSGSNEIDGKTGADKVTSGAEEILSYEEPAVASRETEVAVAPPGSPNSTEGDIYVTDSQHGRIVVFGPGGEYLSQHAIPSIPCGVAVDPSGKVFVGSYEGANAGVTKLTPAGSGALTEDSHFGTATTCQVAASEGFVYAAEFGGQIHKIDSATGTTKYALGSGQNITVSIDPASGHLFTTDHSIGQVEEYDVSGTTEAKLLAITPTTSGPFGVAVEGESGRLYVSRIGHANVEVFGFAPTTPEFPLTIVKAGTGSGTVKSLPPNPGINCGTECSASFEEGEEVELEATPGAGSEFTGWSTLAGNPGTCTGTTSPCKVTVGEAVELKAKFEREVPVVVTQPANPISKTTATLKGTVNPNNGKVTACEFEYGKKTEGFPSKAACEQTLPLEGETPVSVSAEVSGLTASTEYHFRLVAANEGGSATSAPPEEFTTTSLNKPSVTNDPPGAVTQTTAVLKGHVNNNGAGAGSTCKIVIATEAVPGTPVAEPTCTPNPVTGSSSTAVEATASGLTANTKYVYRVVAENSDGESIGTPDQKVQTLPNAPTVTNDAPGAVTQATAVLKGHVNNNGAGAGSTCKIVIATEAVPGTPVAEPTCTPNPVTGSSSTAVEATASGLTANTKYVYRVVATNTGGTTTGTPDEAVATPPNKPTVTNDAPGAVTQTSIVMKGHVNNEGAAAGSTCKFMIALESTPGTPIAEPATSPNPVTGSSSTAVEATASGLTANTKYVYRVVCTNAGGITTGTPDKAVQTLPNAPTVTNDAPGAVTQATAVLKGHVNNNGAGAGSTCKIVIATEAVPGTPIAEPATSPNPVTGSSSTAVEATASGLTANTKYVYRVVCTNAGGITTGTPDKAVQTLPNAPTVTNDAPGAVTQATAVLKGHVNNNGAGAGSTCKIVIATEAVPGTPVAEPTCTPNPVTGSSSTAVEATASGLTANTKYVYRVVATNTGGTTTGTPDQKAQTLPVAPVVATNPEGAVSQTTAVLNGHVDNESATGGSACSFQLTLATDPTYASATSVPCTVTPISGTASTAVTATATGLTANTEYIYRVVAASIGGESKGSSEPFTTVVNAPTVTTTAGATGVAQTAATVAGTVNPNSGNVTACKIEYGTSASYGSQASCASLPGSGSSPVAVSAALTGLTANTTYHFRVVATNVGGTANGSDQTFTTSADTCATKPSLCPNEPIPGSAKQKGEVISLKVTVPGGGTLTATGKNLKKASASASGASDVTLKLKLTSAGKKQLKKKGKLKVKVTITFTPTGGNPGTATKTVTFKAPKKKH